MGEREGERHAAKVVMNGTRTHNTQSGRSLLCGMLNSKWDPNEVVAAAKSNPFAKPTCHLVVDFQAVPCHVGVRLEVQVHGPAVAVEVRDGFPSAKLVRLSVVSLDNDSECREET